MWWFSSSKLLYKWNWVSQLEIDLICLTFFHSGRERWQIPNFFDTFDVWKGWPIQVYLHRFESKFYDFISYLGDFYFQAQIISPTSMFTTWILRFNHPKHSIHKIQKETIVLLQWDSGRNVGLPLIVSSYRKTSIIIR